MQFQQWTCPAESYLHKIPSYQEDPNFFLIFFFGPTPLTQDILRTCRYIRQRDLEYDFVCPWTSSIFNGSGVHVSSSRPWNIHTESAARKCVKGHEYRRTNTTDIKVAISGNVRQTSLSLLHQRSSANGSMTSARGES